MRVFFTITTWLLVPLVAVLAKDWQIHIINAKNGIAEFEEGTNAYLSCSVLHLPSGATPEISWIDVNSRVIKNRVIAWHNLNTEHEGKYKCVVSVDGEEATEIVELKVHKYPKFLAMNHEQHFEINSTARLQCLVSDAVRAGIFWTRNDLPIVQSDRIQFEQHGTVLVIQDFSMTDSDQYACNLPKANSFETFYFNVVATIKAKITEFRVPEVVLEGRDAVLRCDYTGLPKPKLRLYKATTSLNKELIVASEKYHFDDNSLVIRNVSDQDIGEYTCFVENFVSSENMTTQMNVDTKPRIRRTGLLYANLGDTKNTTCFANGKNVKLLWYTNEFNLITCDDMINEQKYSCVNNGTRSTLIYRNVSETDSRKFTCVASNAAGKDVWDFTIELTRPPVIVENQAATVRVVTGKKLELSCKATGLPSVEWTWYQNEKPILGVTDTFFVNSTENNVSILTARNAQPGNYTCEAKNLVSSDRSPQTEVILVEIPQLPAIDCEKQPLLPNRATCDANFEGVPRERLPIGFHVELTISDGGLLIYNSIVEVPYTDDVISVKPLNSSTSYRARFKAFNEAGESNWSEPQHFATDVPTEPEPVVDIQSQCDEAKCSFKWTPGDNNGMPITSYTVKVSEANQTQDKEALDEPVFEDTIESNTIAIYSLVSNTMYKFRVCATNEIGSSDYATTEFFVGDQSRSSAILTIVLICLFVLVVLVVVAVVVMTKCRRKLGGKSGVLSDRLSVEEGQTLVPHTAETKLT